MVERMAPPSLPSPRSAGEERKSGRREEQAEAAALALDGVDLDLSTVGFHVALHEREPEPDPSELARARSVDLVEGVEDPLDLRVGDADAVVAHGQLEPAVAPKATVALLHQLALEHDVAPLTREL